MNSKSARPATVAKAPTRWKIIIGAIGILLLVIVAWQLPHWKAQAEAGAAYGARVGCSCRYVQDRDIASCERDFVPGMEMVGLGDDPETRTVTASVPLLASRSARYAGVSGCLMVPED